MNNQKHTPEGVDVAAAIERLSAWAARFGPEVRGPVGVGPDPHDLRAALPSLSLQPRAGDTLADVLVMTGCEDRAELEDMANIGRSFMERMGSLVEAPGPFHNWAPADDPAELVFDLWNALDEALQVLSTPPAGDRVEMHGAAIEGAKRAEALLGFDGRFEEAAAIRTLLAALTEPRAVKAPEPNAEQREFIRQAVRRGPIDMSTVIGGPKLAGPRAAERGAVGCEMCGNRKGYGFRCVMCADATPETDDAR